MAVFGSVSAFDGGNWKAYGEQLEYFFVANAITDEAQKWAILLSMVRQSTYQTFRELTYPKKPKEHTFSELCDLMRKHLKPTVPSEAVERVKFHACVWR